MFKLLVVFCKFHFNPVLICSKSCGVSLFFLHLFIFFEIVFCLNVFFFFRFNFSVCNFVSIFCTYNFAGIFPFEVNKGKDVFTIVLLVLSIVQVYSQTLINLYGFCSNNILKYN